MRNLRHLQVIQYIRGRTHIIKPTRISIVHQSDHCAVGAMIFVVKGWCWVCPHAWLFYKTFATLFRWRVNIHELGCVTFGTLALFNVDQIEHAILHDLPEIRVIVLVDLKYFQALQKLANQFWLLDSNHLRCHRDRLFSHDGSDQASVGTCCMFSTMKCNSSK